MVEHLALQPPEPLSRLDPEVLDKGAARVLEGLQRVGLALAPVEREHELPAQPLAVGMVADERLQRPDHVGVAAERELRLDELLVRRDPQLLELRDRGLGERLVGEVGERRAAPQGEAALERGGGARRMAGGELAAAPVEEILEAAGVELLRSRVST